MQPAALDIAIAITWLALGICALALAVVRLRETEPPEPRRRAFHEPLNDMVVVLTIVALGPISATLIAIAVIRDWRIKNK
jgi:amino acid transporter